MNHPWKLLVRFTASAAAGALLLAPAVARADDDCPPGSWFCGETQPPSKASPSGLEPLPSATESKTTKAAPPPVVVYQPPPPTIIVQPREAPPAYYYVPPKPQPKKEWGLNLHLGGLTMGEGRNGNAGMGLVGLGLRFRPIPHFALEGDLDFAGGRDYNGYRRSETAFTANAFVFVNPKSKVQVYFLGGMGFSGAKAVDDTTAFGDRTHHYGYFGVTAGMGLEFRLSRVVALNFDFRGILRGRTDDANSSTPEFVDANGRSTNTSGAGLFQGGLTFYW